MMNKKVTVAIFCVIFLVAGIAEVKKHSKTATDKANNETAQGDEPAESSEDSSEEFNEMDLSIPTSQTASVDAASYKTTTLFTTASIGRAVMGHCVPKVYNGNVYGVYFRHEDKRTMVFKAKLDGSSWSSQPLCSNTNDHSAFASPDNHCIFAIDVDRAGYVHVTGGMHSGGASHWYTTSPEDISAFNFSRKSGKEKINTGKVTFASFMTDRHGQLFWNALQSRAILQLYSYDEKTQRWTALGAPNPHEVSFAWHEHFGEIGSAGFSAVWDSTNRMHMAIGMLNKKTYGHHPGFVATDVIYAYSDDGGKTVHKSDGTQIKFPIRADKGPHQGDIVLREQDDPHNLWLSEFVGITVDKDDRPMIRAYSYTTGHHFFRLESGHWVDHHGKVDLELGVASPGPIVNTLHLPVYKEAYDKNYYRDTGELVWVSLAGSATRATYTVHRTVFKSVSKSQR